MVATNADLLTADPAPTTAQPSAITNAEAVDLDRGNVFHSWSAQKSLNPLVIAGGSGSTVWDHDGNSYLDFSSQLVNTNIGHQHPKLIAAIAKTEAETGGPLPTRFAMIAMGRYGGHESGYGSDADVIFVHDPLPEPNGVRTELDARAPGERRASDAAQAVGMELRRLLQIPAPDPPLIVDADLRPEGKQGPLVRSLAACAAYYTRRAVAWESQALLRAEFAVGDAKLGAAFIALADRMGARIETWPGAVHAEHLRHPDQVNDLVLKVIAELGT